MARNTAIFNVGGTKFEIDIDLIQKYPTSRLAQLVNNAIPSTPRDDSPFGTSKQVFLDHNPFAFNVILDYLRYNRLLVPKSVAREVVELQLREFGIPYESITEEAENDELPSYETALNGLPAPRQDEKKRSLKDTVYLVAQKRLDTLISDVILPYLKRHAKRGHQEIAFYLTQHDVNQKNISSDLDHTTGPHEWIYLPNSPMSTSSSQFSYGLPSSRNAKNDVEDEDLPDLKFLLQRDTLDRLEDLIIKRSGVKRVDCKKIEVSARTENEFGLIFTNSFELVELLVKIV